MTIRYRLKHIAERVPYAVGKWTAYVPFGLRLGARYTSFSRLISRCEAASEDERHEYLLGRLNAIVAYAQQSIPFYQSLYGKARIEIRTLEDFEQLPLITKSEVREYTKQTSGDILLNTGGSSGEPVSFYIDHGAWAREWAHMHFIWRLRGYERTDLMLTMLGKNLGDRLYAYNAVHNEIRVNPYTFSRHRAKEILDLFTRFPVRFVQGYPSSIYNFFRELETALNDQQKRLVTSKIRSCFLSSEYPLPHMVNYLSNVWGLDHISWYGHSEMCILAYDRDNDRRYKPFVTYGYAEDVNGLLCGTSFHNYSMPLIRYSTGDRIESKRTKYGSVDSFAIKEGREGEFIEDRRGNKIPLTAMVFGRHHEIFNIADCVQVLQAKRGEATFYVAFRDTIPIPIESARTYFDLSNLELDVQFVFTKNAVRTKAGKLKLKLTPDDVRYNLAEAQ